jgi:hypothetical protein
MAATYKLGTIPEISVWAGEKVEFEVKRVGNRGEFKLNVTPTPKGEISISRLGDFRYVPASEDRDQLMVTIEAGEGRLEKQTFTITPIPNLPSEFSSIDHVSKKPPDPASRFYLTFAEQDAGELRFNDIEEVGEGSRAKVMTKKVTVSGVNLVIEKKGSRNWLYDKLKNRTTLKELTLYADEVVVGCAMHLPGTDVTIYARSLVFDDSGGETACINTTPLAVKMASAKDDGLDGQRGGNIHLYVSKLEIPGNAVRLITRGSAGQEARAGREGVKGSSVPTWNGKVRFENVDLDCTDKIKDLARRGHDQTPIGVEVYKERWSSEYVKKDVRQEQYDYSNGWPTSGSDPAVFPGRPGQGGEGGSIITAFVEQLDGRNERSAGEPGKMAAPIMPAPAGKPERSIKFKLAVRVDLRGTRVGTFDPIEARETKPGKTGEAGLAKGESPKFGRISAPTQAGRSFWLRPLSVRALTAYFNDAMLTGHADKIRPLLKTYLEATDTAASEAADLAHQQNKPTPLDWPLLHSELTALMRRIDGPYDYFGNPAGWVPMLSFQTNHALYKTEVASAVRIMFLAYWVEKHQDQKVKAKNVLDAAMTHLREETQQALNDYAIALAKISRLDSQSEDIQQDIKDAQTELEGIVKRMRQAAKDNLKVEHFWRSSAKIVGGLMELIPVGQPVLGAFGKSITVLSDIDLDSPSDSLGDLAGAWKKVGTEKLAPKFAELFKKLKGVSEKEEEKDDKKADFKKALAKEELEKQVEAHMEEQKNAKESIVSGFSGFAVSEDDIAERLEQVKAQSPEFKKLTEDIEKLNKRKAAFYEDLVGAVQAMDLAANTILKNQMGLIQMRGDLDDTLDKIDFEALQYVQGMGQRARERLLIYKYYLLKSYHYLALEPFPDMDFQAQKVFDKLATLLAESSDGMLSETQYKSLAATFEDDLRVIANKIIRFYETHKGRTPGYFDVQLTKEQLAMLNSRAKRVELDLLWKMNRQREDVRITSIETKAIGLAPLPAETKNLGLEFRHDGLSRIRRGGKLFLFRSGEYRVDADSPAQQTAANRSDKVFWSTDVSYNPFASGDKLTWTNPKEDVETESLVRYLVGADEKSPWISFRPSAWTNLRVIRSGDYGGKIEHLVIRVNHVYYAVNDDVLSTVVVKVAGGAQPLIRCNVGDVNGRTDGQGSFVRTFDHTMRTRVTLTAPQQYGKRAFKGWLVTEGTGSTDEGPPTLEPGRSLKLDVKDVRDHLVEAVYEAEHEKWPPCPEGWIRSDWLLVNSASSPITINRVAWTPLHRNFPEGWTPLASEPQGSEHLKLSFSRLTVAPEESLKLSVCAKSTGPNPSLDGAYMVFGWDLDDVHYAMFFTVQGNFSAARNRNEYGWIGNRDMFAVDERNRTVKFGVSGS